MTSPPTERVDAMPLRVPWVQQMAVAEHSTSHWAPHRAWDGLRYG